MRLAGFPFGHQRFRPFEMLAELLGSAFLSQSTMTCSGKAPTNSSFTSPSTKSLTAGMLVIRYAGDGGVLLGVELAKLPIVAVLIGQTLQDGTDDPARPAPRRPEVHQHRHLAAALDHVHVKVVGIESAHSSENNPRPRRGDS